MRQPFADAASTRILPHLTIGRNSGPRAGCVGCLLVAVILAMSAGAAHAARHPPQQEFPPLVTTPGAKRLPGKFVWADLVTDNGPAALRFYAALFQWNFKQLSDVYVIAFH